MKYLFPYFKKYRLESILAPLFKALEAAFDLCVPLIVASMVNTGIARGDGRFILMRFGLLIIMALLGLLSSFAAQFFAAKAAVGAGTGLRRELFKKIQSFDFSTLDTIGASTLITRITSDVNQVQNGVNMFLRLFLRSPFIVFGAMALAFFINRQISLIFLGVILVLFVIVFGIMNITTPLYRRCQQRLDNVTAATRESLNGVRVIRAFGREGAQQQEFAKANNELLSSQIYVGKIASLMNPFTYITVNMGIVLVLWLSAGKVNTGVLLSGDVIALVNYISQILVELVKLANLVVQLGKSVSCMERVEQILDTKTEMDFPKNDTDANTGDAVRFENVSLCYKGAGAPSLSGISFSVKKGETVGIIGGTGSGKTSLVNLIPRFYDASGGCVYIHGVPAGKLTKEQLLSFVSIVPQKSRLFSGTIRSNLLWGNENATDEELWAALKTAQAAEFVQEKQDGLSERVASGGANFSGGQKQRLCIARALCKKADILILDDSASALDYKTEAELRAALSDLPGDITVFIVSQRTSSIMHADKIIVLDDGKIAGLGTHKELLENCEIYKEIYESQFETEAGK